MKTSKRNLAILSVTFLLILGCFVVSIVTSPDTVLPPPSAVQPVTSPINQHQAAIAELQAIRSRVVCPGFLDAPLGFKPCPAKDEVDAALALLEQ